MFLISGRTFVILFMYILSWQPIKANKLLEDENNQASDFLNASTNQYFDLKDTIPGVPGIDYPIYRAIPQTSFSCSGRLEGYYADTETRCQAFRICAHTSRASQGFAFLCPNGTVFSQRNLVCDWYRNVNCDESEKYYDKNQIKTVGNSHQMLEVVREMMEYPIKLITQSQSQPASDSVGAANTGSAFVTQTQSKQNQKSITHRKRNEMKQISKASTEADLSSIERSSKTNNLNKTPDTEQTQENQKNIKEIESSASHLQPKEIQRKFTRLPEIQIQTQSLQPKQHQNSPIKAFVGEFQSDDHRQKIELLRRSPEESRIYSRTESQKRSHQSQQSQITKLHQTPTQTTSLASSQQRLESSPKTQTHSFKQTNETSIDSYHQRKAITNRGQEQQQQQAQRQPASSSPSSSSGLQVPQGDRVLVNNLGELSNDYIKQQKQQHQHQQRSTIEGIATDLAININDLWVETPKAPQQVYSDPDLGKLSPKGASKSNDVNSIGKGITREGEIKRPRSYVYPKPEEPAQRPNEISTSHKLSTSLPSSSSSTSSSSLPQSSAQFSSLDSEFLKAINFLAFDEENPSSLGIFNEKFVEQNDKLANSPLYQSDHNSPNFPQSESQSASESPTGKEVFNDPSEFVREKDLTGTIETDEDKKNQGKDKNEKRLKMIEENPEENKLLKEQETDFNEIKATKNGQEHLNSEEGKLNIKKITMKSSGNVTNENKNTVSQNGEPQEWRNNLEEGKPEIINVTYSFAAPIMVFGREELEKARIVMTETTINPTMISPLVIPTKRNQNVSKQSVDKLEEVNMDSDVSIIDEDRLDANEHALQLFLASLKLSQQENEVWDNKTTFFKERMASKSSINLKPTTLQTSPLPPTPTNVHSAKSRLAKKEVNYHKSHRLFHRSAPSSARTLGRKDSTNKTTDTTKTISNNTISPTTTTNTIEMVTVMNSVQRRRRNHHRFATIQRASMKPSLIKRNIVRTTPAKSMSRKTIKAIERTTAATTTSKTTVKSIISKEGSTRRISELIQRKRMGMNRLRLTKSLRNATTTTAPPATATTQTGAPIIVDSITPRLIRSVNRSQRLLNTANQQHHPHHHQQQQQQENQKKINTTTSYSRFSSKYRQADGLEEDTKRVPANNLVIPLDKSTNNSITLESVRRNLQRYQVNHSLSLPSVNRPSDKVTSLSMSSSEQNNCCNTTSGKATIPTLSNVTSFVLNQQQQEHHQQHHQQQQQYQPQYTSSTPLQKSGTGILDNTLITSYSNAIPSSTLSPLSASSVSTFSLSPFNDKSKDSSFNANSIPQNFRIPSYSISLNPSAPFKAATIQIDGIHQSSVLNYGNAIDGGYQQSTLPLASPVSAHQQQLQQKQLQQQHPPQQQLQQHYHQQTQSPGDQHLKMHDILIAQAEGQHIQPNLLGQIDLTQHQNPHQQQQQQQQQQAHAIDLKETPSYIPLDDFLNDKFHNNQFHTYNNYYTQQQPQQQLHYPRQQHHDPKIINTHAEVKTFTHNFINQPYQQQQQKQLPPQQNYQNNFDNLPKNFYITPILQQQQLEMPSHDINLFNRPKQTNFQQQSQQPQQQQRLYNNHNLFSQYNQPSNQQDQQRQQQQQLQQQPEVQQSRGFLYQKHENHRNNLPQQQQIVDSVDRINYNSDINNINNNNNDKNNRNVEFLKSINIALPARMNGLLPSLNAQRRSDDVEEEEEDDLHNSIYEGASSYDVPLNSIGPLPRNETKRNIRVRRRL